MELFFVYNANGGLMNGLLDFAHKNLSPKTYSCNLCAITYGNLGMKKEWKQYLEKFPHTTRFFHKDEFTEKYPDFSSEPLPAIFITGKDCTLQILMSATEINTTKNISDLIHRIEERLLKKK